MVVCLEQRLLWTIKTVVDVVRSPSQAHTKHPYCQSVCLISQCILIIPVTESRPVFTHTNLPYSDCSLLLLCVVLSESGFLVEIKHFLMFCWHPVFCWSWLLMWLKKLLRHLLCTLVWNMWLCTSGWRVHRRKIFFLWSFFARFTNRASQFNFLSLRHEDD